MRNTAERIAGCTHSLLLSSCKKVRSGIATTRVTSANFNVAALGLACSASIAIKSKLEVVVVATGTPPVA